MISPSLLLCILVPGFRAYIGLVVFLFFGTCFCDQKFLIAFPLGYLRTSVYHGELWYTCNLDKSCFDVVNFEEKVTVDVCKPSIAAVRNSLSLSTQRVSKALCRPRYISLFVLILMNIGNTIHICILIRISVI